MCVCGCVVAPSYPNPEAEVSVHAETSLPNVCHSSPGPLKPSASNSWLLLMDETCPKFHPTRCETFLLIGIHLLPHLFVLFLSNLQTGVVLSFLFFLLKVYLAVMAPQHAHSLTVFAIQDSFHDVKFRYWRLIAWKTYTLEYIYLSFNITLWNYGIGL